MPTVPSSPWPKRRDGSNKTLGEMTPEERRTQFVEACEKLRPEIESPEMRTALEVFDGDPNESSCAHEWVYTGTAYGGDDERWLGEGRCYCSKCGADGDA